MQPFSDWLLRYGIILGKRRTKRQRLEFLRAAQKEFAEMGYAVDVTRSQLKILKGEKADYYNLYAGNLKAADVVFATYYDTPVKSFGAYPYYAFSQGIPKKGMLLNLLLPLPVLILSVCLLYFVAFRKIAESGVYTVWGVLTLLVLVGALFLIRKIRGGIPNRYNMVRNTSSLIVLFQLAASLTGADRRRTAFALLDGATSSDYGFTMLESYLGKRKGKKLVYLDSIGNPGRVQILTNDASLAGSEGAELHPQQPEQSGLGDYLVTAGEYEDGSVRIPHANRRSDTELEEDTVRGRVQALESLLEQIGGEEPSVEKTENLHRLNQKGR